MFIFEIIQNISYAKKNKKLLIIGAGNSANKLLPLLDGYKVISILDKSYDKIGRKIGDHKIQDISLLKKLIENHSITHIFVALPNITRNEKLQILRKTDDYQIIVRFLPNIHKFFDWNY